jgi:ketosteroid isomerase-like protein
VGHHEGGRGTSGTPSGPHAADVTGGTSVSCTGVETGADEDLASLLAANQAFYTAFETRDLDAMSDVWERSSRATCTHPGWATLRGWPHVQASFFALFGGSSSLQFVLTEAQAHVHGDTGWVTVDEDLLGDQHGATVAALNLFARDRHGRWRMVAHHGSSVNGPPPRIVRRDL